MKNPDSCVLALDNGGTKCEALLVRADGVVLGRGFCRKAGLSGRSKEATRHAAREALRGVPGNLKELRIGCLGHVLPESFFARYAGRVKTRLVTEAQGIFALTGHAHGVIALSGTGAFIHARTIDGREMHLDGLGPLIGDYGGGFFIGREALRAAACATWAPRRETLLREAVLKAYGAKSVDELIPLNWTVRDRSEIAQLAPLVEDAANAGDRVAKKILEEAADALAETLCDVVDALEIRGKAYPLIGAGSVATRSDIFWRRFCRTARTIAPKLRPERALHPAVAGLALAVMERPNIRGKLFASLGALPQQNSRSASL